MNIDENKMEHYDNGTDFTKVDLIALLMILVSISILIMFVK